MTPDEIEEKICELRERKKDLELKRAMLEGLYSRAREDLALPGTFTRKQRNRNKASKYRDEIRDINRMINAVDQDIASYRVNPRNFHSLFMDCARRMLPPETFQAILIAAKDQDGRSTKEGHGDGIRKDF